MVALAAKHALGQPKYANSTSQLSSAQYGLNTRQTHSRARRVAVVVGARAPRAVAHTGCSEMSVEANGLGVCGNAPIPTLCNYIVART